MQQILLIIHLIFAVGLVGLVLLQRSEGGALGIGGGGMGGLLTGRASANLLTRVTAIFAALFMATSLGLTIFTSSAQRPQSILEEIESPAPSAPAAEGEEPAEPSVPIAE